MNSFPINGAQVNGSAGKVYAFDVRGPIVLTLRNPYQVTRRWSISSTLVDKYIYLCILHPPEEEEKPTFRLPMTSLSVRLRDGAKSYIGASAVATDDHLEAVADYSGGTVEIRIGVKLQSGEEATEELITGAYESLRYDMGGRSGSLTLVAYGQTSSSIYNTVRVSGVSYFSQQANGSRRIRCEPSFFLRPSDTVVWGDGPDDRMTAGLITINVSVRESSMEVTEADG